jgi:hypothetical protein
MLVPFKQAIDFVNQDWFVCVSLPRVARKLANSSPVIAETCSRAGKNRSAMFFEVQRE